mgnify:CR=1 FL=1
MPTRQNNFAYLLVALVIYLVALPLLEEFDVAGDNVIRVLSYSTLLVIGVWSLNESGKPFRIGMTIVIAAMILNLISYKSENIAYTHATVGLLALFLTMMLFATMKQVLLQDSVNVNRIYGAVCAYLLLGVIWALAYATLHQVSPDAFRGISDADKSEMGVLWLYYSFVTLSTLGYGDITPVSPAARVLAYTQAIFGAFYMAILVAGLVGVYISTKVSKEE